MSPSPSTNDIPDGSRVDPDVSRDVFEHSAIGVLSADAAHKFLGQLRVAVRLADLDLTLERGEVPPLGSHVSQVLRVRPKPQMIRPNTRRIVAAVANVSTRWYRANGQFIGDAVGFPLNAGADHHYPVATGVPSPLPLPTVAGPVNTLPEAFGVH